jgi:peptide chain release factor 1
MDLLPHIERFSRRFAEVESALSDSRAFDNPQRAQELSREYARLKELVAHGQTYQKTVADLAENAPCFRPSPPNRTQPDGQGRSGAAGSGGKTPRA